MLIRPIPIIRNYIRWVFAVIFVGIPILLLFIILSDSALMPAEKMPLVIMFSVLFICGLYFFLFVFWEKFFAHVLLNNYGVKWTCPLRKKHFIPFERCRYVGIAYERHDDLSHPIIYISTEELQEVYLYRIHKKTCSNEFVKFAYSLELCDSLIALFPKNVVWRLLAFRKTKGGSLF